MYTNEFFSEKQFLIDDLGFSPKSFAEIQYEIGCAQKRKDFLKEVSLQILLSIFFFNEKSLKQAFQIIKLSLEKLEKRELISCRHYGIARNISKRIEAIENSTIIPKDNLSQLEAKLIESLNSSPKTKFEIIDELYGSEIDSFAAENRLKNILFRLKSKFPGLIRLKNGKYFIVKTLTVMFAFLMANIVSFDTRAESNKLPWLVEVGSKYVSESENAAAPIGIHGQGVLARVGNRYFVISSSHLTQGQNTFIKFSWENVKSENIKNEDESNWLSQNSNDLELIEIPKPRNLPQPIFVFNFDQSRFELEDPNISESYLDKNLMKVSSGAWTPRPEHHLVSQTPVAYNEEQTALTWNQDPSRILNGFSVNFMLHDQILDSVVVPGMSGGPLLTIDSRTQKVVLAGLAKAKHRFFPKSYFSLGYQISDLFQNYIFQGKKGQFNDARWKYGAATGTYLDYGNGNIEIETSWKVHTGGGETSDVGGGETGDVGQSSSAQSPHIKAGMTYQNDHILGFKIKNTFLASVTTALYANNLAVQYLKSLDYKLDKDFELISGNETLMNLLKEKALSSKFSFADKPTCFYRIDDGGISLKLINKNNPSEYIAIELNQNGALKNSRFGSFEPILKIPLKPNASNIKRDLVIDTKGLFFTDLNYSQTPTYPEFNQHVRPNINTNSQFEPYLRKFGNTPNIVLKWPEDLRDYPIPCAYSTTRMQRE